jgi:hypothetical protein
VLVVEDHDAKSDGPDAPQDVPDEVGGVDDREFERGDDADEDEGGGGRSQQLERR